VAGAGHRLLPGECRCGRTGGGLQASWRVLRGRKVSARLESRVLRRLLTQGKLSMRRELQSKQCAVLG